MCIIGRKCVHFEVCSLNTVQVNLMWLCFRYGSPWWTFEWTGYYSLPQQKDSPNEVCMAIIHKKYIISNKLSHYQSLQLNGCLLEVGSCVVFGVWPRQAATRIAACVMQIQTTQRSLLYSANLCNTARPLSAHKRKELFLLLIYTESESPACLSFAFRQSRSGLLLTRCCSRHMQAGGGIVWAPSCAVSIWALAYEETVNAGSHLMLGDRP